MSVALPSIFGNPFRVTPDHPPEVCLQEYEIWLNTGTLPFGFTYSDYEVLSYRRIKILQRLPEIYGKDLACWCKLGSPCHRDVLLVLVKEKKTPGALFKRNTGAELGASDMPSEAPLEETSLRKMYTKRSLICQQKKIF